MPSWRHSSAASPRRLLGCRHRFAGTRLLILHNRLSPIRKPPITPAFQPFARADDRILMRVFIGGALQPELTDLPDDDIRRIVREELGELLGIRGEPEFCDVVRWLGMMPQYHVGHLDLVAKIEARAATIPSFALAGNAYRGVGIPFCVKSGEQAAERLISSRHTPCAVAS
jgi:protoporphyrinogen oxidase